MTIISPALPPGQPPALPADYRPRPRLHGHLTLGMTSRRLTTVVAPPGYGKTTLVAGWLAELQANAIPWRMAWLAPGDDTPTPRLLLRALTDAIRLAYPAALPGFGAMLDAVPAIPSAQLINELTRGLAMLPGRLLLVLDNVDQIDQPDSRDIIRGLVTMPTLPLHLVLISHDSLRRAATDALRHNQITEITEADLLLTDDEIAAWLGPAPRPQSIERVRQATGGRALGVALARALPLDDDDRTRFFHIRANLPWRTVLEQMLRTIATALPDEERRAWLGVALVGQTELALAAGMVETPNPAAALGALVGRGLLGQPAGDCYAIHPLVGRVLVQGETSEFGPEAVRQMRRRAADWLWDAGQPAAALHQWLALGDVASLAAAVESLLPELERQERWPDMADLLAQLPPQLINSTPTLLVAHTWCRFLLIRGADIAPQIDRAEALLDAATLPDDQTALLRAELQLLRGLPGAIAERLARREQINDIINSLARQRTRARAEALHGLFMSNRYSDENWELAERIEQELADGGDDLSPALRSNLLGVLTGIYARHGPLEKLEQAGRAMLGAATEARNPGSVAWARVALGMTAFLQDDPAQAIIQLEEALYQSSQLGAGLTHFIAFQLLPSYAQMGMGASIPAALEQAGRIRASSRLDRDWPAMEAYGRLLGGDRAGATAWADQTPHPAPVMPLERRALVLGHIALANQTPERLAAALDYLDAYIALIDAGHFTRNNTHAHALRARLLWALGRREEALDTMEQAIDIGYAVGFHRFLIDGGPATRQMLEALAQSSDRLEVAHDLMRRHDRMAARSAGSAARTTNEPTAAASELLLSRREEEILQSLAEGHSNKEIGARLGISSITVRNHTARLYTKLGVSTRAAAVRRGRELGLV